MKRFAEQSRASLLSISFFLLAGLGLFVVAAPSMAAKSDQLEEAPFKAGGGLYLGLNGGYVGTYYENAFGGDNTWHQGSGNGTAGALMGYQFSKSMALEVGYNYIFRARAVNRLASGETTATPQVVYGALKMIVPIYPRLDIFGKAGLGYVHQTIESKGVGAGGPIVNEPRTRSHIGAALGVGASYYFTPNIYTDFTYMRVSGQFEAKNNSAATIDKQIPNLNMFLIGIGMYFGP